MVPEGWVRRNLDQVADVRTGVAKGKTGLKNPVSLPYLRVANVQDGFLDLTEMKEIEVEATQVERYSLRDGDIVLTEGGDFDKLGRGTIWRGQVPDCLHQNHVFAVRVTSSKLMPEFFAMQAGSKYGRDYFLSCAKRSTNLASINSTQLKQFPVLLPPLPEQQKIAEILGTWDKAIETTEALLANARTQKRALMRSLLTGTRRFPGFEDHPWREVRLGDVVAGIPGGGTPDKGNPSFWGGDLPWVSVKDLKSTVLTQTQDTITEAGLSSSATNAFLAGTIVMATRMAVGSCAILGSRMAINQDLKAIIPNDLILNRYLFHCLQMSQDALASLGTGSTVKGITLDVLRELRIGLPVNKDEQSQISDAIDCADDEVSALQSDLNHLRTEKKSLMQQLLTGKRRVVV